MVYQEDFHTQQTNQSIIHMLETMCNTVIEQDMHIRLSQQSAHDGDSACLSDSCSEVIQCCEITVDTSFRSKACSLLSLRS